MVKRSRPRAILELLETKAASRGDEITRVMVLWPLSALEWLAGRWTRALEHATAAHELTEQTQHSHAHNWVGRAKALLEADLGLVDDARASVDEVLAHSPDGRLRDLHHRHARCPGSARARARQPGGGR